MPHIQINGANLYYEEYGAGHETIVFSHGLLWSGRMFYDQIAVLKNQYRCITFDFRGQGQSELPNPAMILKAFTQMQSYLLKCLDVHRVIS